MSTRADPKSLIHFSKTVLVASGLSDEAASAVAEALVEADLYGHHTHGLALLEEYVEEIDSGGMTTTGRPEILVDHAAVATWDARRLPGVWTTKLAVDDAVDRARRFGTGAIAIRNSHHIACLATFIEAPARAGFCVLVLSSDPSDAHVAPHGGLTPVMTPNPVAAGIPCEPDPILLDVSTSITTAARTGQAKSEGGRLPGPWLLSPDGSATDDPSVFGAGGSILPIGGLDHGHKGYGLSVLVEALTQGLSGFGRSQAPTGWGASVLTLAFSPTLFGSGADFLRETSWLSRACREAKPSRPNVPVRLPGEAALAHKRDVLESGLVLSEDLASSLQRLSVRFGIPLQTKTQIDRPSTSRSGS